MKINELNFGEGIHNLYYTFIPNFIAEQPTRFELIEGPKCHSGYMFFCERYLDAVVVKTLFNGTTIYFDLGDESGDRYVVISQQTGVNSNGI